MESRHLSTRTIHAGEEHHQRAVVTPIYQSSTFLDDDTGVYDKILYSRLNNTPGYDAVHAKIAALEGTDASLVTSSGMSAITTTLLTFLSAGDHLIAQDCLYGGAHTFVTEIAPRFGIETTLISTSDSSGWADAFRDNTRAVYFESLTNPLLGIIDIPALVALAHQRRTVTIIDNTFLSPVQFRPAEHGVDVVLHSGTKYMNGHSDLICGIVSGSQAVMSKIRHLCNHLGGSLDPHGCFLLSRGLKTLELRVTRQAGSALALAEFLSQQKRVRQVNYPGLRSHPQHQRASQLFSGFGGMLSFEIDGDVAAVDAFLRRLTIPLRAPSLGGPETLVTRPSMTSHAGVPPQERLAMGITDTLIRCSVGLEHPDDLIDDFQQALQKI